MKTLLITGFAILLLGSSISTADTSELTGRISHFSLQTSSVSSISPNVTNAGFPQKELDKLNVLLAKAERLDDFKPTGQKNWTYKLKGKFLYKDTPIRKINISIYQTSKFPWVTRVELYGEDGKFAYDVSSKEFVDYVYKIINRLEEWNPGLNTNPLGLKFQRSIPSTK